MGRPGEEHRVPRNPSSSGGDRLPPVLHLLLGACLAVDVVAISLGTTAIASNCCSCPSLLPPPSAAVVSSLSLSLSFCVSSLSFSTEPPSLLSSHKTRSVPSVILGPP